jgi:hypothetical protein
VSVQSPTPPWTPSARTRSCGTDPVVEPANDGAVALGPSVGPNETAPVGEGGTVGAAVPTPDAQPVAATERQNAIGTSCRVRLAPKPANRDHGSRIMKSPF